MFFLELFLFALLFLVFPFFHANFLYRTLLSGIKSPFVAYTYSCLFTVAVDCLLLLGEYSFLDKKRDFLYLAVIIVINVLAIFIFSIKNITQFTSKFIEEAMHDFQFKISIAFVFLMLAFMMMLIRPFNSDILDYFEIGKVFYHEKALIYQGSLFYSPNAFEAHVFHPPFYTLLLSLGYLIQGSSDYLRVNSYISIYFMLSFMTLMLVIMRRNYVVGFLLLMFALFSSRYALSVYVLPNGLDAFRFSYFLLSFSILRELVILRTASLQVLFALSLAASLSVHSSGLLFIVLMLVIYLSVYIEKNLATKYLNSLKIVVFAACLGGVSYAANLYHIGKLISDDTPLWSQFDYYTFMNYERNIFSQKDMFNVIFQQFFSLNRDAYGMQFFVFLSILVLKFKTYLIEFKQAFLNCFGGKQKPLLSYSEHYLFIVGFYLVLVVSIFAKQDLIIKNFRYLFMVYPSLIVFTYAAVENITWSNLELWSQQQTNKKYVIFDKITKYRQFSFMAACFFVACIFCWHINSYFSNRSFTLNEFKHQDKGQNLKKLLPGMSDIIQYLQRHVLPEDSVFAFERGQLYQFFPNLKIYHHLNDQFINFYKLKSKKDLYDALRERHIHYIFVSSYRPSIVFQSKFSELLVDPRYITMVVNQGSYYLFKLNDRIEAPPHLELVNSLKVSLLPMKSDILNFKLQRNKQYLVRISSSEVKAFYSIKAYGNYSVAEFTYNADSEFSFLTDNMKIDDNVVVFYLKVESKDKKVDLDIRLSEIRSL